MKKFIKFLKAKKTFLQSKDKKYLILDSHSHLSSRVFLKKKK